MCLPNTQLVLVIGSKNICIRMNRSVYRLTLFHALAGSHAFVEEVLLPYLSRSNATVVGVLVLDGVLHFDAFPATQSMPEGFEEVLCIITRFGGVGHFGRRAEHVPTVIGCRYPLVRWHIRRFSIKWIDSKKIFALHMFMD